ncbi:MAG: EAL domain-containing protein [Pseudomonadota bacterium]
MNSGSASITETTQASGALGLRSQHDRRPSNSEVLSHVFAALALVGLLFPSTKTLYLVAWFATTASIALGYHFYCRGRSGNDTHFGSSKKTTMYALSFFSGSMWALALSFLPEHLTNVSVIATAVVALAIAIQCLARLDRPAEVLVFNLPLLIALAYSLIKPALPVGIAAALLIFSASLPLFVIFWARERREGAAVRTPEAKIQDATMHSTVVLENQIAAQSDTIILLEEKCRRAEQTQESGKHRAAKDYGSAKLYHEHPSILMSLNSDGWITEINHYGARYLGYPHASLLRLRFSELCTDEQDVNKLLATLPNCESNRVRGRLQLVKASGEIIAVQATLQLVADESKQEAILVVCEDVTEIDQVQKQLAYHASRDTLTGLYNRREFEIQIAQLFQRTKRHPDRHVLCFIDLDRFKPINDTSGHLAGDEILKLVTKAMKKCMRQTDIIARLGGDEFGIIMERTAMEDAQRIIDRLRTAVQNIELHWDGVTHKISASFGLTKLDEKTQSVTNVMRDADAACYLAKESGRNCIRIFNMGTSGPWNGKQQPNWSTKLRAALSEERLFLALQPVINQQSNCVSQHEALIRIEETDGTYTDAYLFITAAERLQLVSALDKWIFDNALDLLERDSRFRVDASISVNLATATLTDKTSRKELLGKLAKKPSLAKRLCIEISETSLLYRDESIPEFLQQLRGYGTKITIDDFGTSLAGLDLLDYIDVDFVKFDPLLIEAINSNSISQKMFSVALNNAQSAGVTPIAKSVTNQQQIDDLRQLGVSEMQGYAIRQPVNILSDSLASLRESA